MSVRLPRVVVTGLGAVTPIGLGVGAFWTAAVRGDSGSAPITRFDASGFDTRFACELKGFDPLDVMDRKLARRLDPFSQYAMAAAAEALSDAGIDTRALTDAERARVGVMIGSGQGGMLTFQHQADVLRASGPGRLSPFFVPMLIADSAGGAVALEHGLRGPNHCVVSACATGNDNIGSGFDSLRAGRTDIVLVGGAEAPITELGVGGFCAARALSTRNESPRAASRPFDRDRDGFVLGEGAAVLVLETLDSAMRRGARIYAELLGVGAACDAHHMTAPHPEGLGARLAMDAVFRESGLGPADVDTINMHATSTGLGDAAECQAIVRAFGDNARRVVVTSTKSMTGHMLGAAGAAEAVLTILSIVHGIVPPTINLDVQDAACAVHVAANTPVQARVEVAMSNAFGFGGHNTSALFAAPHVYERRP